MAKLMYKLYIILWKNMLFRKRNWISTLLELVTPTALFVIFSVLYSYFNRSLEDIPGVIFPEENVYIRFPSEAESYGLKILFTPRTDFTDKLMAEVSNELGVVNSEFIGLNVESEIELTYKSIRQNDSDVRVLAIIFEGTSGDGTSKILEYKIRSSYHQDISRLYTTSVDPLFSELYLSTGFATLQYTLDKCYIQLKGQTSIESEFAVQPFPIPKMKNNDAKKLQAKLLPILTALSFILLCFSVLKRVLEEKKSGIKELMKLMGLKTWMLWFGWLSNALLPVLISVTIIVLFLKMQLSYANYPVLASSASVVWIFLIFYCLASVAFLFALSALFQRPITAMMCGIILWIGSFVAAYFVPKNGKWTVTTKMLTFLFPNIALYWGYDIIFYYESMGCSFEFDDLVGQDGKQHPNELLMKHVWLMFLIDILVYAILTLYCEAVHPGTYGIARSWYFPCMKSTWRTAQIISVEESMDNANTNTNNYEPSYNTLVPGIKIHSLYKIFKPFFGQKNVAVDGITLDIYKNQITVLLGHTGAGKSTTMLILTGMYSATSGSIYIDGYDVHYHISKARESLGLCPQQNMVFADLTVKEHLMFFGMLRGLSKAEASDETQRLLIALNLTNNQNKIPIALSRGTKRKLCLGIALIGHPKVVILDEPTSDLDPQAQRQIWDLLLSMRRQQTIVISTHYMEEADVLGDRIAIMDHGHIKCYGSSKFLKDLYGTGYQLKILKDESTNEKRISETVQSMVPNASVKSTIPSLVIYDLPSTEEVKFSKLFSILEKNKNILGIQSVGVSFTTMEEVFFRVGETAAEEEKIDIFHSEDSLIDDNGEDSSTRRVTKTVLFRQQLEALLYKRVLFTYRTWMSNIMQALPAVVIMVIITYISVNQYKGYANNPLKLTLEQYGITNVMYTLDKSATILTNYYENTLESTKSTVEVVPAPIQAALMKQGEDNRIKYKHHYIIAAAFNISNQKMIALYSEFALHSIPISINMITNALLKHNMNSDEYSISVTNHPFQDSEEEQDMDVELTRFLWGIIPVIHIFWMGIFMVLPVTERVSEMKHLQLMTGVSPITYWFTCYMWDTLLNLIVTALMLAAVAAIDTKTIFSASMELMILFIILTGYGISAIPFSYLISYTKATVAGCYAVLLAVTIVFVLILDMTIIFLELYASEVGASVIKTLVQIVPVSAFSDVLQIFSKHVILNNECRFMSDSHKKMLCDSTFISDMHHCCFCTDDVCEETKTHYIQITGKDSHMFRLLMIMIFSSIIYFSLILLIDYGVFEKLHEVIVRRQFNVEEEIIHTTDSNVNKEQRRIQEDFSKGNFKSSSDYVLLVSNLAKSYSTSTAAVKGISFGVASGECFGLLGVNGAGKTTTFRMLTGGVLPTRGKAAIRGWTLSSDKTQYLAQIGYCPQHNPIIDCFTAWEQIQIFARLRGVPTSEMNTVVRKWIKVLDLREYQHRRSETYSAANRRKLSTALALVGSPPLVFLDEPTSGLDFMSRMKLWRALLSVHHTGQSIVLSSNSMEECEALCNRLGIMTQGKIQCLGNIQHLKQKFGKGFTIRLKLNMNIYSEHKVEQLKSVIASLYTTSTCVLKDEHQTLLHYHVSNSKIPWSTLFKNLENLKNHQSIIEDYSISETTLEQVFLSLNC